MKTRFTPTTLAAMAALTLFVAGSANAAIISLSDYIAPANAGDAQRSLGSTITGQTALYMVGTITWNPDATTGEATANFTLSAGQQRLGFGSRGGSADIFVDGGVETVGTGRPAAPGSVNLTVGATTTATMVIKIDQTNSNDPGNNNNWTTGDPNFWFWFNPNLSATEASQPTNIHGWWSGQSNFVRVDFNLNGSGPVSFTNFAVYTDGDTPFIPEPTSLLLLGLGSALMLGRRRRS